MAIIENSLYVVKSLLKIGLLICYVVSSDENHERIIIIGVLYKLENIRQ